MLHYHRNPSDRKDVLINTLCDLLHLHDCPSISKDTMRALMKDLRVSYDGSFRTEDDFIDDVIYWVRENYRQAEVLRESHTENTSETLESLRQQIRTMKAHYDNLLFWIVLVGVILLVCALAI